MGSDKAALRLAGVRLVDRAVAALAAVADPVAVASGDGLRLEGLGVAQLADAHRGVGPLGGVVAGLEWSPHPLVAVLAVDHVQAEPELFARLASCWSGAAAVVPVCEGRLQPLHAVWSRSAAPALRGLVVLGERSVVAAVERLGAQLVEVPPGPWTRNVNRPEDLSG